MSLVGPDTGLGERWLLPEGDSPAGAKGQEKNRKQSHGDVSALPLGDTKQHTAQKAPSGDHWGKSQTWKPIFKGKQAHNHVEVLRPLPELCTPACLPSGDVSVLSAACPISPSQSQTTPAFFQDCLLPAFSAARPVERLGEPGGLGGGQELFALYGASWDHGFPRSQVAFFSSAGRCHAGRLWPCFG